MKIILSGLRPTANLHIGNYLGAVKPWASMQSEGQRNLFCIVDMHALTTAQREDIRMMSLRVAASYLACGLDPTKSIIFVQSQAALHGELAWLLGCHVPLGWLYRMTQFKEKVEKTGELWGLLSYPVLQTADILLYNATHVPVGEDQKQHIELARDIAISINTQYQKEIFVVPEPVVRKEGARIMSLQDGSSKMGKSDGSDLGRINLVDDDDTIAKKIKKAKTDSEALPGEIEGLAHRPEAKNLLTIWATFQDLPLTKAIETFAGKNFSSLKTELADVVISHIRPIRESIFAYEQGGVLEVLQQGNAAAREIAQANMVTFYRELNIW